MGSRALVGMASSIAFAAAVWSCVGDDPASSSPDDGGAPDGDAQIANDGPGPGVDAGGDADAAVDAGCNATMPFVTLASVGNTINTSLDERTPRLTADELVMYYTKHDAAGFYTRAVIRSTTTSPWVDAGVFYGRDVQRVGLWTSADLARVYYGQLDPTNTYWRIVHAKLDAGTVTYADYVPVLNGPLDDLSPYVAADETEIWWQSDRGSLNVYDIYSAPMFTDGGFGPPQAVTALNTPADESFPVLSADKRTIYFASTRGRAVGMSIWMATRATPADTFSPPILAPGLAPLEDEKASIPGSAWPGSISPDECRLYVTTTKDDGSEDLYVASRR